MLVLHLDDKNSNKLVVGGDQPDVSSEIFATQ